MTDIKPSQKDLVFQHRALARSVHTLPLNLRRLIVAAMSKINVDESMEVTFTLTDAMAALGVKSDTRVRESFRLSCREALKQIVSIQDDDRPNYWRGYSWFSYIEIDGDSDRVTMKFNPDLKPYISDFTQNFLFSKFTVCDYGKLTSEYSQKIFDLINSRESQANEKGFFFVEYTPAEWRAFLQVPENAYPRMSNFNQRVIDYSVKIINDADIGYRIEPENRTEKGKRIRSIRLNCWKVSRSDPRNVSPATDTEKELEHYRRKYSKEFEKLRKEFLSQDLFKGDEEAADNYALKHLREKYKDFA